jgi:hypothetical protein
MQCKFGKRAFLGIETDIQGARNTFTLILKLKQQISYGFKH